MAGHSRKPVGVARGKLAGVERGMAAQGGALRTRNGRILLMIKGFIFNNFPLTRFDRSEAARLARRTRCRGLCRHEAGAIRARRLFRERFRVRRRVGKHRKSLAQGGLGTDRRRGTSFSHERRRFIVELVPCVTRL
jgi:hypothetical protein